MAFGNATIGDLKKIAGGGGGGTKDYTELINKPSINGVELLAGTNIGKLSGDIKVSLSAIDNVSLTTPTNAQALLFDALTSKWKNGNVRGFEVTDVTSDILDSTKGIDMTQFQAISFVVKDQLQQIGTSGLFKISDINNNDRLITYNGNLYSTYDVHKNDNILYLTKSPDGQPVDAYKIYAY